MKIPIPTMLLKLRNEISKPDLAWNAFAESATRPFLWRAGLTMLPMARTVPVHHPLRDGWVEFRELPNRSGRAFRQWWNGHQRDQEAGK